MYTKPTIIDTRKFSDNRGFLIPQEFTQQWVQQNISQSTKGTFRGMHFQIGDAAQSKLVQVIQGSVIDFVFPLFSELDTPDLEYFHLSDNDPTNQQTLFVPKGYAHGFIALEQNTIFHYLVDTPYNHQAERSIHYKSLPKITDIVQQYGLDENALQISEKDAGAQLLSDWKKLQEPALPLIK